MAIALGQFLFFLLMFAKVGFVDEYADNADRGGTAWGIFRHTVVTNVEIARFLTIFADSPTVAVFYRWHLACCQLTNSSKDLINIVGMNMGGKILSPHLRSGKQAASQSADSLTSNIVDDDIVVGNLQRLLHHLVGRGSRSNALVDTMAHDAVLYQYGNEQQHYDHQQQIGP